MTDMRRGRTVRERRLARKVAPVSGPSDARRRRSPRRSEASTSTRAVDDAEVELAASEPLRARPRPPVERPARPAVVAARRHRGRDPWLRRRVPDLSALPPLLAGSGTFAALARAAGAGGGRHRRGRRGTPG